MTEPSRFDCYHGRQVPDFAANPLVHRDVFEICSESLPDTYKSESSVHSSPFKLATAQVEISADVRHNGRQMRRLLKRASKQGARLIHFPEGALSGYVKAQIKDWADVDWSALREELEETVETAGRLGIWAVIGCNHRLSVPNRPHNSVYIVSDEGKLFGRYDKRFCSNTEITDWYSPGTDSLIFAVDGVRFGCALCIEIQFPEVFAEYERQGVDCMLFSTYSKDPMFGITAQAHAVINAYWVSLSTPTQCSRGLRSGLIGPNGQFLGRCRSGQSSFIVREIDRDAPSLQMALTKARPWRRSARDGHIYATRMVNDPRSLNRGEF